MLSRPDAVRASLFSAGLLAVLGTLNGTLEYGARHVTAGDAGKISQVMLHAAGADADLVIFGASNAESGISPAVLQRVTGRTAVNLALDGTRVQQYGALVREYLRYGRRDATVVFAVNAFSFQVADLPTSPSWYYPHIDNPFVYEAMASFDPVLAWRARYVPFYGFVLHDHTYYKNAVLGLSAALRGGALDSGFTPRAMSWSEPVRTGHDGGTPPKPPAPPTPYHVHIDEPLVALYRSLIAAVDASGRGVLVVFPPITTESLPLLLGLEAVLAELSRLAGGRYLDYHLSPMGGDHRYFYNFTHLNADGAEIFSTLLGRDLRSLLGGAGP
jgi:hypothetical protein